MLMSVPLVFYLLVNTNVPMLLVSTVIHFSYTFILYYITFIGSFVCECNPGYALQTDGVTCKAVSNTFVCPGGYTCQDNECAVIEDNTVCSYCERGTELSSDGTTCVDLDECLQSDTCPYPSSFCQNTNPLYFCECNQGYDKNSQVDELSVC